MQAIGFENKIDGVWLQFNLPRADVPSVSGESGERA
jgi:hypothetical protein